MREAFLKMLRPEDGGRWLSEQGTEPQAEGTA